MITKLENVASTHRLEITSLHTENATLKERVRELEENVREMRAIMRYMRVAMEAQNQSIQYLVPIEGTSWPSQISQLHMRTEKLETRMSDMKMGLGELVTRIQQVSSIYHWISTIFSHHPIC